MRRPAHFLSFADFSKDQVRGVLALAAQLKQQLKQGKPHAQLKGKSLAMIFEKPSTRTRVSFDVGMYQLGGHAVNLSPGDIQMDGRETVPDIARTLSRMVDGIMLRTFSHSTLERFAAFATVPVINGLSDLEHPCQAMADLLTVEEHFGSFKNRTLVYVGDGNNVAHSLLLACAAVGMNIRIVCPKSYCPEAAFVRQAKTLAGKSSFVELNHEPAVGVRGADILYTDVWTSMGQESESKKRVKVFRGYQIDAKLLAQAKKNAIVLHCLPAHRGEEISDQVLEGKQSLVFDQAENRLHAQKAILTMLMRRGRS